jgi:signal transduction histidine kinase
MPRLQHNSGGEQAGADGGYRRRAIDIAVAVLAFAFTLGIVFGPEDRSGSQDPDGIAVLLAALATLPLVARRRFPIAVLVFVTLASALMIGVGYPSGPPIGPALAVFFVGSSGARLRGSFPLTIGLIGGLLAIHLVAAGIGQDHFPGAELLFGVPLFSAVWFAGDRARLRRDRLRELEERARRAEREAERERQLAVAEERTRISRDLHDSAGHAINVILVHAGAARLLAEKDPERSKDALETIETVARETLTEIDQLVGALREDEGANLEPPVGFSALASLAQRHRDAGLEVELDVSGDHGLAPAVNRAAYRIVQESLTNALRHGDGAARVTATYGRDALEIEVTNPVAGDGISEAGHGLVGMRERASLVGGTLEAERANGAFRVRARLPYGSPDST